MNRQSEERASCGVLSFCLLVSYNRITNRWVKEGSLIGFIEMEAV